MNKFNTLFGAIMTESKVVQSDIATLAEDENFIQCKQGYCFFAMPPREKPIIYNLFIFPEFRRKGYAQQLLEMVIYYIRKNGYKGEICIEVNPKENSISKEDLCKFYTKLGLTLI